MARDAGYILNLVPSGRVGEVADIWNRSGGRCTDDAHMLVWLAALGLEAGRWSAPVGARSGSVCLFRVGSTAHRRLAATRSNLRLVMVGSEDVIEAVTQDVRDLRDCAGHVIGAARLVGDAVQSGPRSAFAPMGVPVLADGIDGNLGTFVDDFGGFGRRVSRFGGVTRMDSDELAEVMARCGIDAARL